MTRSLSRSTTDPRRLFIASCTALVATIYSDDKTHRLVAAAASSFASRCTARARALALIFTGICVIDRLRGGYRVERIGTGTAV